MQESGRTFCHQKTPSLAKAADQINMMALQ
jgi:hypothetical protein